MKKPLLFPFYENNFVNSYREFIKESCLLNQKHLLGKSFFLLLFFMSLMSFQEINAQTCVSEKITVRMKSFSYSGTEIGGTDIRVVGTANIGASTATAPCFAVDNITAFPVVPQPVFIISQAVTCGAALPVITVSYNAHEDNAITSNCTVQPLLGEVLQQSTLNIPINISTIRTIPSHSITQNVTVGSGASQWDVVFEVVWDNIVSVCGINATPNDSKGYATAAAMNAVGGTEGCTAHDFLPGTTFNQYSTVRSDQYGTLGIVDYISVDVAPTTCSANTRATRTGTEKLYLKDPITGLCTGAIIPKTGNGTNSGSFNPEWTNLTPNTDYIIFLTTTVDASCTHLSSICVNYYGIPPMFPAGSVYNDDGKGGGSSGNCAREGGEDASTIPAGLFAKLKLNSSAAASQAVAVQANGSFAFAGTIATGTYTVFLDNNSTLSDVTSTLPANWSGTASWTGTITAGVLAPAFTGFCLRDVVAGPCSGNHYVQWSLNPWTAGSLTKNITLGGGLTMNTTISNPNGILAPGYPQMFADIPSVLIQTNSASKSITWTSVFNQKVSGVSFSLYDIDNVGTLKELLDVKGYNGSTVVNPVITIPFASSVVIAGSSMSGTLNNVPTYSPFAKANISFNQTIDRVEINYRNNKNVYYPRPALLLVSDFTIFCPVAVNNPDKIDLAKSAPTGNFAKGDTVTYTFRFNNGDATNKTVDFTDALPAGFTWVANSYISPLATPPNAYGGTNTFTLTGASVPPGITIFTIDAIANGAIGINNNQASFTTNGNTYQSDNPYTATALDPTPVTLIAPPPVAPITMTKSVDLSSVSSTGEVKFTYSFSNTNASAITVNFTDEVQPDSVRFKPSSLVRTGATGGTANVYDNTGYLSITGLSIPAGSSSISVNALMSGQPTGTYSNYATILPTGAGFRAKPNNSNSVNFTVVGAMTATNPPAQSALINDPKTGTASTDLAPTGGNGTYVYSVDNSASCTPVAGATALPASSNLTVTNATTGAYTYTAPATAGTYYYCIKVCDTSMPTPSCITKTYTLTVTATPVPFAISPPPVQTVVLNAPKSGNAATDLAPTGGTGPYVYSDGSSDPACVQPVGTMLLPASSNLTINSSTGAYSYTTPITAGTYYFCVKVCDSSTPTANCAFATYKVTVTAPACNAGTVAPGVN